MKLPRGDRYSWNKSRHHRHAFLSQHIVQHLTPDLLRGRYKINRSNPLAGHCYVASEVAFHILGGKASGWKAMRLNHQSFPELANGETHWFIQNNNGDIIDPTAKQFSGTIPYHKATGTGFLTKEPSARANKVLKEMSLNMCEQQLKWYEQSFGFYCVLQGKKQADGHSNVIHFEPVFWYNVANIWYHIKPDTVILWKVMINGVIEEQPLLASAEQIKTVHAPTIAKGL
jgi:hypothetical protein